MFSNLELLTSIFSAFCSFLAMISSPMNPDLGEQETCLILLLSPVEGMLPCFDAKAGEVVDGMRIEAEYCAMSD